MLRKYALVNLGCPKNLVDGEGMQQKLAEAGYVEAEDFGHADAIIVNTCGFIDKAKEESIKALLELAALKRPGQVLIAAGCLSERYAHDLGRDIPELNGILGTQRWVEIAELIEHAASGESPRWTGKSSAATSVRRTATAPSAYLKIADGCSVGCAFCAIPKIKGPHRSKPGDEVIAEARQLADQGVKEIVLVAQNTTAYGHDWGQRDALAQLLDRLVEEVPDIPWIRLMYTFPDHITPRLLETMARHDRIVKYIDLPLQHAHPGMLRAMRRPEMDPREIIALLREAIPGVAVRSAFIVGYPGEGEEEFGALLSFLGEAELDRVGVFTYSQEEGTLAAALPNQVPGRLARQRYRRAMELQQGISLKENRALIGREVEVLVESKAEVPAPQANGKKRHTSRGRKDAQSQSVYVGRSYRDAPEVDGVVFVHGEARVGEIAGVRITEATEYDVVGEVVG
ncbi:MAG: 30S ribosomal protein S12 methylthiotransferase RimO [Dehalococcoidales bacterium]|nr:30S ribosomal protein S12 methylthiotransferase RimO [Dehalococcoidales bacterium]